MFSLLLTILFSWISHQGAVQKKLETLRSQVLQEEMLQMRLQDFFTSLYPQRGTPSFYTTPKGELHLCTDQGIDVDPHFSGPVLVTLSLQETKDFLVQIDSLEDDIPARKEIWATKIEHLSWEFLGEKHGSYPISRSVTPELAWHLTWPKERTDFPYLVLLHLQIRQEKIDILFRFPTALPRIVFEEAA